MASLTGETSSDVLVLAVVPGGALLAAFGCWRVRRSALPLLLAAVGLAAWYVVSNLLIVWDYEDADGFMDCWPNCSGVQDVIRYGFWLGGALLALVAVVGVIGWVTGARRRARESA